MDSGGKSARGPTGHQPWKAELEDDMSNSATPEALAGAVTRGGADRRHETQLGDES